MISILNHRTEKQQTCELDLVTDLYQLQERLQGVGRPLFDGKDEKEVVAKLQFAFSVGATAKEACFLADISTDSFYRYCNKYPEFRNKIELLQTKPVLLARMAILNAISNGDAKLSMWYLERKRPQEFSVRVLEGYMLSEQEHRIKYLENLLRENNVYFNY